MPEIIKPVFIIGAGRSGTTILYNLLSIHPDLCWFSNYTDRFPSLGFLPAIHRVIDLPYIGSYLKKEILKIDPLKIAVKPEEAQKIYHDYCNFEYRFKTTEKDLKKRDVDRFKSIILSHLKYTKKKRFISKQTTNNQRLYLINKMFPEAYYIHIIRDGRAVACSLVNVPWWLATELWWAKKKVKDFVKEGRNELEIAALHWEKEVEEIINFKKIVKDRFYEFKYEKLCKSTKKTISEVIDSCGLKRNKNYYDFVPSRLENQNYKYHRLTKNEKNSLNKILLGKLAEFNYDKMIKL